MTQEKKKNLQALNKKYQNRFTYTRLAREATKQGDFVNAIRNYNEYLKTMADIHDLEPLSLTPAIFDAKKELSELLLVSQIYWELSKIYDMTPKLQSEFSKVLNQFVVFTINQPFQVVNAEILRKYLKKPGLKNYGEFKAAYDKIFIESDKCFISTFCFGNDHQITKELRLFKNKLSHTKNGRKFIELYYRISSPSVNYLIDKPFLRFFSKIIASPILFFISTTLKIFKV